MIPADNGGGGVHGPDSTVQPIPFQSVPDRAVAAVADLDFAGRYVPAGAGPEPVAGDFYDLLVLDADLVAVIVGDVAGHGAAATARMHQLRAATRAYAIQQPGPATVLERLDRFCARLDPEAVATLWYGEYRRSTGTLTYASAGHPPPVLTSHGDATTLLDPATSPPLGAGDGHSAPEHQVVLSAGAILVAYSDGLVERRGTDLEEQIALLQTIVEAACHPDRPAGADSIAAEILAALVPDPETAEDDVCLLVVRREPDAG
jgi:serine phosphatase RsbU (regulator of sigma subunit)